MHELTIELANRLLSKLNLEWYEVGVRYGLYYKYKLQYYEHHKLVTKDFNKVKELLQLPELGNNLVHDCHIVANNRLFDRKEFKKDRAKISLFLDVIKDYNYQTHNYAKKELNVSYELLKYCNLKIADIIMEVKQEIANIPSNRNKFNGRLVRHWLEEMNQTIDIGDAIHTFEWYIWTNYDCHLYEYLQKHNAKEIRAEFKIRIAKEDILSQLEDFPF